jgi:hypothetical protein
MRREFFTTAVKFQVPANQRLAAKSQINSPAPRMFARNGDKFRLAKMTAADARLTDASTCVSHLGDQAREFLTIQPTSPVKIVQYVAAPKHHAIAPRGHKPKPD